MSFSLRGIAIAATITCAFVPAGFAQDAMATDAMAADDMAPATVALSDAEFELCMEQAGAITFPAAQHAAAAACHGLHQGMDVMGTMQSLGLGQMDSNAMSTGAMGTDAMAVDPMAADAMAPATK